MEKNESAEKRREMSERLVEEIVSANPGLRSSHRRDFVSSGIPGFSQERGQRSGGNWV